MNHFVKLLVLLFILSVNVQFAQEREVEAFITAEVFKHTEYYYRDSVKVTLTLNNNSGKDIKTRVSHQYLSEFISEEKFLYDHCFTFDRLGNNGRYSVEDRTINSFVTIPAGGEYTEENYFFIGWLCRNAPPRGEWNFSISYNRIITAEDNYYHLKSYYSDKPEKISVEDAWIGEIESNKVMIKLR